MHPIRAAITAVGGFVPETRLTNSDLETMVETTDEWIRTRTGIRERRILRESGQATSDLIVPAILQLCAKRGIEPSEIDCMIVGTITGDLPFPSTANLVCDRIGAKKAWGFDLAAACSGFLYALTTGAALIESGRYRKVVVVGADKMSSIIDYRDRNTCIIFGDGAGAVLLEPGSGTAGVLDSVLKSDGSGAKYLRTEAGGSLLPASMETVSGRLHYVKQEGAAVYKFAVKGMAEAVLELMERNHLAPAEITWLVPHQANLRIIESTAERAGIPMERVMVNIERFGNTTAATLPLCLWEWESRLKKGDRLVLAAFGGGFTWGATLIEWAY
jgi:3-oxoacyl-[acyl-carrier-protein] synthase-3